MLFLSRKHDFQLFTAPTQHSSVVNPPSFNWPQERYEGFYHLELESLSTQQSWRWEHVQSPVQIDFTLPCDEYHWRVFCQETNTYSDWNSFTIGEDTETYLAPTAQELFAACDEIDQFLLYFDADIETIQSACPEVQAKLRASVSNIDIESIQYPNHYRRGFEEGKRTAIANVRNWIDRDLMALTLLYRVWGDEKSGEKACDILLRLSEWSPEGPASLLRPCFWGDEVGLSLSRNLYLAYHWLSPLLKEEERSFVRPLLVRLAFQMEERLEQDQFKQYPGHSHTSRLPAYLGIAALTLHKEFDVEVCERWLNYALMIYRGILPFYGGKDGSWVEGPFYSSSYTKWHHPFFLAVERLSGFSFYNHPFYKHYVNFAMDFVATQERIHPFGDGFWCQRNGKEWPGFFAQNPLRIYAKRFGDSTAQALEQTLESEIDIYQLHLLDIIPTLPQLDYQAENTSLQVASSSQTSKHVYYAYAGLGKINEKSMSLYYRASQFGNSSHRHADQGNFAFVDNGQNILTPSGSYGYRFGSQHHSLWTRTTQAHNLPLIDGAGQKLDCSTGVAHLVEHRQCGDFDIVVLDLTQAYTDCKRYYRTLVQAGDLGVVVFDEIDLYSPKSVQWRLHTPCDVSLNSREVMLSLEAERYQLSVKSQQIQPPALAEEINDEKEFYGNVESDAQDFIRHIEWQCPAKTQHRILMSCTKSNKLQCVMDNESFVVKFKDQQIEFGKQLCSLYS